MMLKQKTTLNNGHRKHLSEPKNQGRDSERWTWSWLCFCLQRCCTPWTAVRKDLWEAVKEKCQIRGGKKNGCSTIKTPPHIHSLRISRDFLIKHITHVPQHPYSPNLPPIDFSSRSWNLHW
jgi:hypothetical protein